MRLDYLSPLPPVRSGIADYSVDLLPHLAARPEVEDLRVVRLPGQEVSEAVEEAWRPVSWETFRESPEGRLPLYQMGNNPYHEAILDAARERPGVLVLHDLVLHHQLLGATLGRSDDLTPYENRLGADHGRLGRSVARAKLWGAFGEAPAFAFPARRTLLRRQRGVLVHSRWAAEQIAEEDQSVRVRAVPMGIPLPPPASPEAGRAFRERWGIPADAPLLGSIGFQTPIKRTGAVIRALAEPSLAAAHLVVVGQSAPVLDLPAVAREAGVAERVHVTGFVDFAEMEAAIAACDLCCNLRYPTAGETSASLLRILAVGRPVVVSDYAQFAELPATVAVRAPLPHAVGSGDGDGDGDSEERDEAAGLARVLGDLLTNPDRLRRMGQAAREHVAQEHAPERAAAAVAEACRDWRAAEPPGDAENEETAPTTLTWSDLPWRLEVEGDDASGVWPVGERRVLTLTLTNPGPAVWKAGCAGPGGVAVEMGWDGEPSPSGSMPWVPLPRDVAPGESITLRHETRKPPAVHPAEPRFRVRPHVLGAGAASETGGRPFPPEGETP